MTIYGHWAEHVLCKAMESGIHQGVLTLITPAKHRYVFTGEIAGASATWEITDWSVVKMLVSRGDVGLGEAYAAGMWHSPDVDALFCLFVDNLDRLDSVANGSKLQQVWFRIINHFLRRNSIKGSSANIQSHYDVGNEFYKLWLDPSMTYSSALYHHEGDTLSQAQSQKYQRILTKIDPARKNILEIGCGWGGFAEEAAHHGHRLTGLTISQAQHDYAKARMRESADIRLLDYRKITGKFDAIASIEMFEAVGKRYWPSYFSTIKDRLDKDGVAMVQTITVKDDAFADYEKRSDYIRHYVFPGGLLPSVEKFKESAERAGLVCREVYAFGQDYARTLREWLVRFTEQEKAIRALGYDDAFIRSWRLYLSMCAASFARNRTNVVQVELVHA